MNTDNIKEKRDRDMQRLFDHSGRLLRPNLPPIPDALKRREGDAFGGHVEHDAVRIVSR